MTIANNSNFSPEDLAALIDTSSMDTSTVWKAVVSMLTSAATDNRTDEEKEIIRETIEVLTPLMKSDPQD